MLLLVEFRLDSSKVEKARRVSLGEFASIRGILISALAIVLAFKTIQNPKFGIITFMVLLFLRDSFLLDYFAPTYEVLHLPLVFSVLSLISIFLHSNKGNFIFASQFWLMILFFVIMCLSRLFEGYEIFGNKVVGEFFRMCVFFFLVVNSVKTEKDINHVIWTITLASAFAVLYHYYYYRTGWRSIFAVTVYGTLNRNDFAAALVPMCPLSFFLFKINKHLSNRILFGISFVSFIAGVILTDSRGGFLALIATLIIMALLDKDRVKVLAIMLVLGALMGLRISENYTNRINGIQNYEEDASSMGRVATYKAAINMIKTHPLLGVGAGNFNDVFLDYVPYDMLKWVAPGKSIHNVILQVASENGILGLSVFMAFIVKSLLDIIRLKLMFSKQDLPDQVGYRLNALFVGFLGYFIALQFVPGAYYSYIYIFIPLIVATKQVYQEYEKEKRQFVDNIPQSEDMIEIKVQS
jgi:probable O-glycosylation ligase (exosortase A-associated)